MAGGRGLKFVLLCGVPRMLRGMLAVLGMLGLSSPPLAQETDPAGDYWSLERRSIQQAPRADQAAARQRLNQPTFTTTGLDDQWDALLKRLDETEARLEKLEMDVKSGDEGDGTEKKKADGDSKEGKEEEKKDEKKEEKKEEKPKSWYEKYRVNGYTQFRINETLSEDFDSAPAQYVGDSAVGDNRSFSIRRARVILSGDVNDHLAIYLQPDFAVRLLGNNEEEHFVQLRDWYGDVFLDGDRVHRIRVGQSKVPYGWENLQSSRNRIPLDRNDALNSAVRNERDLGIFYYWTPKWAQDYFEEVLDEGLKGSGNYGVFGAGFYNGQGGSLQEQNDNLHFVTRLTLPMELESGQRMELGVQGYTGKFTVLSSAISPLGVGVPQRPLGTLETGNIAGIRDERIAGTLVWYPQPIGFQSEWTVGRGPGLNSAQDEVVERALYGGYAMTMIRWETESCGEWIPFVRWQYYKGGYKSQRNAPFSEIDEWELGTEWQMTDAIELVTTYSLNDRTNTRSINEANALSYRQFEGSLLRFQLQIRY